MTRNMKRLIIKKYIDMGLTLENVIFCTRMDINLFYM